MCRRELFLPSRVRSRGCTELTHGDIFVSPKGYYNISLRLASIRLPGGGMVANSSLVSYGPGNSLTTGIFTLLPKQYYRMSSGRGVLLWVFGKRLSDDQSWFRKQEVDEKKNHTQRFSRRTAVVVLPAGVSPDKPLSPINISQVPSVPFTTNYNDITWASLPIPP